jgi:hypothetical protein
MVDQQVWQLLKGSSVGTPHEVAAVTLTATLYDPVTKTVQHKSWVLSDTGTVLL